MKHVKTFTVMGVLLVFVRISLANDIELSSYKSSYPDSVIATIPAGDHPLDVVALPNGNYVYITIQHEDNVLVMRTSDNTAVDTIPVGNWPREITVLPNGNYIYVANTISDNVSVIRTSDNTVVATIPVGDQPYGIAALSNGNYVYVTNIGDDNVSVIRTSDNTVVATIPVGDSPFDIAVLPNGNYIYVSNIGDDNVSVIRTSDNTVVDTIPVGEEPNGVVALPNGNYIYVANRVSDNISVIQTSDNTVVDTVPVGDSPDHIALLHPNGDYIYVSIYGDNTVSVIRTSNNTVVDTIPVSYAPTGLASLPNGNYVYVTNHHADNVSVIGFSTSPLVNPSFTPTPHDIIICDTEYPTRTLYYDLTSYSSIDTLILNYGYFNFDWIVDEYPTGITRETASHKVTIEGTTIDSAIAIMDTMTKGKEVDISTYATPGDTLEIVFSYAGGGDATGIVCPFLQVVGAFGIEEDDTKQSSVVSVCKMSQNYPNPMRQASSISYEIPRASQITLSVYNITGQKVRTLVKGKKKAGDYTAIWDGRDNNGKQVASSNYFYRLEVDGKTVTKKAIVLR